MRLILKILTVVYCLLAFHSVGLADTPAEPDLDQLLAPLSEDDVNTYQKIFRLQEKAKWKQADRYIKRLDNKLLLGHLLYQRYMHPTGYRSKYRELANWMLKYPDHPGAKRIYNLAKKKGGSSSRLHKPVPLLAESFPADKPTTRPAAKTTAAEPAPQPEVISTEKDPAADQPGHKLKKQDRKDIAAVEKRIRRYLRRHKAERAEKRLWAMERRGLMDQTAFDTQLAKIAHVYYLTNQDDKAYVLANMSAERSRQQISQGDWVAGLAAWRLGDCASSAEHFEKVAYSPVAGDWTSAAGAFWAARSHLVCRQPDQVFRLLERASSYHRTFYGLIASRLLAQDTALNWQTPEFSLRHFKNIQHIANVRRAVALAQLGRIIDADMELSQAWRRAQGNKHAALLGLAAKIRLPGTQLKIGKIEEQKQMTALDSTLYPLPDMEPEGGFTLDRALLFAVMRQESEFNSWARSSVGARGLMQLMPRTASYVGKDRSLRYGSRIRLDDPKYNMALGQKYMQAMLGEDYANGNLFKLMTAYNAGPGNLRKWERKTNFQNDPLLFIESIPARETRNYIEKVLSNYWIYRMRMGQDVPSLDEISRGEWPKYYPQDDENTKRQQHAHR